MDAFLKKDWLFGILIRFHFIPVTSELSWCRARPEFENVFKTSGEI